MGKAAATSTWRQFLLTEILVVLGVFAVFTTVESLWLTEASLQFIATTHMVRGLASGFAAIAVAAVFIKKLTKEAENESARWFRFLEQMPVSVFALNRKGEPYFANTAAQELLGKGIDPSASTDDLSEAYSVYFAGTNDLAPSEELPVVQVFQGAPSAHATNLEIDKNGKRVRLEVWAAPVRDATGRMEYAVATFIDTSARQALEDVRQQRALEESQLKQLQEFRDLQQRFINHAAHQLYTPLTPLRLQVESVRDQLDEATASRLVRNVDRLRLLATQMLRVAKSQQFAQKPVFKQRILQEMFNEALEMIVEDAKNKNVTVDTEATTLLLNCDQDSVTEAIYHGLHNAIKFSDEGQTVTLSAKVSGNSTIVEITDDGGGIAGKENLFEPFVQGDDDADIHHGWGLGLYLAKAAVDLHKGSIEIVPDSDGKGAALRLTFPTQGPGFEDE